MSIANLEYNFETMYELMEEEEKRWTVKVRGIMDKLGIDHYPDHQEFKQASGRTLYEEISAYCGHALFSEIMGVDSKEVCKLKNYVFDIMDKYEIPYYPPKEAFMASKKKYAYNTIERKWGHDKFMRMMKLYTQDEYNKLAKGKCQ